MRYPELKTLVTPHLTLRKVTADDVSAYFRLFGSPEVAQYMLWEPHREMKQSADAVQKLLSRYEAGKCYRWGITETGKRDLIGIVELLRFDEEAESCSFAYMLAKPFWGRGYGTETLRAIFAFAFESMDVRLITADHFTENTASGRAMRKAGMDFAGTLPGKYEKRGIVHSAEEYRITKEQWEMNARC